MFSMPMQQGLLLALPVVVAFSSAYYSGLLDELGITAHLKRYGPGLLLKVFTGIILTYASAMLAQTSARKEWERKEFFKNVQVSLNYVADEGDGLKLRFRTLDECDVDVLMHHQKAGVKKVTSAAKKTTAERPFLQMDFHSQQQVMTAVQNRLSKQFASGYLDYDMQIPCIRKKYYLGLTCEKPKAGAKKFAIKLRIMVASEGLLKSTDWDKPPGFERKGHIARWECLREMSRILKQDMDIQANRESDPDWFKKTQLRDIVIFRPLHFPLDNLTDASVDAPAVHLKQKSTSPYHKLRKQASTTPMSMINASRRRTAAAAGGNDSSSGDQSTESFSLPRRRSSSGGAMQVRLRRAVSDEGKISLKRDGSRPGITDADVEALLMGQGAQSY